MLSHHLVYGRPMGYILKGVASRTSLINLTWFWAHVRTNTGGISR